MSTTPTAGSFPASLTQSSAIPLTTQFTPPSDCTAAEAYTTSAWAEGQIAWDLNAWETSSCFPQGWRSYQGRSSPLNWYSPGACPYSFNYVATSIQSGDAGHNITLALCCPPGIRSGYQAEQDTKWHCVEVITTGGYAGSSSFWDGIVPSSQESDQPRGTTAYAEAVSVAWQDSDLSLFSPPSAPILGLQRAGVTFASSSSVVSTSTRTPSVSVDLNFGSTSSTPPPSSGFSAGEAAGIGVGATLGGILAIGAIGWFLWRTRRRSRKDEALSATKASYTSPSVPQATEVAELPHPSWPFEADSRKPAAELENGWVPVEVDAGVRSPI